MDLAGACSAEEAGVPDQAEDEEGSNEWGF